MKPRKPGAWRGWTAAIDTELLLAQMDPEDLDAAEGKFTDDYGIARPQSDNRPLDTEK